MNTYSEAFQNLHYLAVDTLSTIDDLESDDPVALATKNIANFLSAVRMGFPPDWGTKEQALEVVGGLTETEWNNIKELMIKNASRISIASTALRKRRREWITDLETVWAFGHE